MLISPTRFGRLTSHLSATGLIQLRTWRGGRTDRSGVYARKGRVCSMYHAAYSHGGARGLGVWPRVKVSMMNIVPPHLGHGCDWSRSSASTS